jgi:crossover junction endodeoxyribonuclease RuvC
MTRPFTILGIDPGSRITGFGVVTVAGRRLTYVTSGCIRTQVGEFTDRLRVIFEEAGRLVAEYRPDELAIERVFVHKNADSALKLGHARAAALCATFAHPASIYEYAPREIKLAVTGSGSADKRQIQEMVIRLLELSGTVKADAADALAVAICHAHMRDVNRLTGAALARRSGR